MAELMLLTIPERKSSHVYPFWLAIIAATDAERISIIWLDPSKALSPNMNTLIEIKIIKKTIGIKAWMMVGFLYWCIYRV